MTISAYPDVQERALTNDYEFIVLACDGIWDVLTNQEVIDFIRARIAHRMEPETVSTYCK
jgi:protein phosphatase 2C family protein 2/3